MKGIVVSGNSHNREIEDLLEQATNLGLIGWNEGLVFHEVIHAVWRMLLKNEHFKSKATKIQQRLGDERALELLAKQFNNSIIKTSSYT